MNQKKIQNKAAIFILGLVILIFICTPFVLYAIVHDNDEGSGFTLESRYLETNDGIILSCLIYRPNKELFEGERPAIVCIHGNLESKETMKRYSEDLARTGFVVLSYDQRGFGESEGISQWGSPDYEIKDLQRCIEYLKTLDFVDRSSIGVVGFGYGGAVAIMGAAILKDTIDACFAMSSYSNLTETFRKIEYKSIQANLIEIISKYLGFLPDFLESNELTDEQLTNIKGFVDLIKDIPSLAGFQNFIILEDNRLSFNQSALRLHSPAYYASNIPNNSLYLAVGEDDSIYPFEFSKSLRNFMKDTYNIHAYYHMFTNIDHALKVVEVDNALINFFNFKLRDIKPYKNDFLSPPYIPELGEIIEFDEEFNEYPKFDQPNIFLIFMNFINFFPISFLIPFSIVIILVYLFCVFLFFLKENVEKLAKPRKIKRKEYIKQRTEKKSIVRRLDKRRIFEKTADIEKRISRLYFFYNKKLGTFILLITTLNFILIPIFGMLYSNYNVLMIWLIILVVNAILSLIFFSTFEGWEWASESFEKDKSLKNKQIPKETSGKSKLSSFVDFLKKKQLLQVLLYLFVLFLVVASISFIIVPFQIRLTDVGLNQIISTLIIASVVVFLVGILLLMFDKKFLNPSNNFDYYGLSKKKMFKGLCFGVYIVQIPLVILMFSSYILTLPMPYMINSYSSFTICFPFIFLYFFGFELIFRSLIETKIINNKWKYKIGEFIVGTLLYAQFMGIFGYLIFMNSYSGVMLLSGITLSYSGLFGILFAAFSIFGTLTYMITRTPVAPAISNALSFIFVLSILI